MRTLHAGRLPSIHLSTWAFLIAICTVMIGLDGVVTWNDRLTELHEAQTETSNLARSLAEHAQGTFRLADTAVIGIRDDIERWGMGRERWPLLHEMMTERVAALRTVRALMVCDALGSCVATSGELPKAGVNIEDREHFRRHRLSPDRGPMVGTAVRFKLSGEWVVSITRRIDRADGTFAGEVGAIIPLSLFEGYYGTFDVGSQGVISLVRVDGRLVARQPFSEAAVGISLPNVPTSEDYPPRPPTGNFEYTARVDGIDRLASYRRVDSYPLIVTVARAKFEILEHWRTEAWWRLLDLGVVMLVIMVFGSRLAAQIRGREQADQAMARLADEYRVLTESLTDLVTRVGMDLVRNYVSPSCRDLLGYEPEELVGRSVQCTAHPDDWPVVQRAYATMLDEAGPGRAVYQCRGLRKDGTSLWIETCGRRLGPGEGFVLTSRDISARKEAEFALEALTRADGLTALANRRGFDEALEREFYRAARNAAPLALIMIDVDCFKAFNDGSGHLAGDDCLRAIAGAVSRSVRRPDDVAARYGGEEFAVLLPDVGVGSAIAIAEQIRAGVAALAIEQGGEPARFVTVSAGVASMFPGRDSAGPADLVKAADDALYAAKRAGRDRVCSAQDNFAAERPAMLLPFPM